MSIRDDYERHDAVALAGLVRAGDVKPAELLEVAIERAEQRNPDLNAIVIPMYDEARSQVARGLPEGPFRGVPFLLKDLHLLYTGVRTTYGSRLFRDNVADHDSELTSRYRRAGLAVFGKTASPEFGLTTSTESALFGQTKNPWKPTHMAGGSSGGAAAAVAAGIVPVAHASDGGGSIRIPASCCGLFGLKPTRARVPAGPDVGEGWSGMSANHVVSRSVRDSAALLDATHGPAPGDPYYAPAPARPFIEEVGADPGRLRIAVHTEPFNATETHPDCAAAVRDAAELLASLGHEVEDATLRVDKETLGRATQVIIAANLRATVVDQAAKLGRELREDDLEPGTHAMANLVQGADAAEYARSIRVIHAVGRQVAGFLSDYDVLLTPTMATPPMELGRLSLSSTDIPAFIANISLTVAFTQLFNASGHPAASLPLFWNDAGLPVGVQAVGRFGDEATLLRLASQLEQARPWFDRRPTLG
jgi:Asp-tRNA(Asn)/Glu-tRNA(Gln) amidotransferase A subunit family amidase